MVMSGEQVMMIAINTILQDAAILKDDLVNYVLANTDWDSYAFIEGLDEYTQIAFEYGYIQSNDFLALRDWAHSGYTIEQIISQSNIIYARITYLDDLETEGLELITQIADMDAKLQQSIPSDQDLRDKWFDYLQTLIEPEYFADTVIAELEEKKNLAKQQIFWTQKKQSYTNRLQTIRDELSPYGITI